MIIIRRVLLRFLVMDLGRNSVVLDLSTRCLMKCLCEIFFLEAFLACFFVAFVEFIELLIENIRFLVYLCFVFILLFIW